MATFLTNLLKDLLFCAAELFLFLAQNRARALRNDYKAGLGAMSRTKKPLRGMSRLSAFPKHHSESGPRAGPGGAQARAAAELA
jgi:hypothetical protein